jgi:hypothetical protein
VRTQGFEVLRARVQNIKTRESDNATAAASPQSRPALLHFHRPYQTFIDHPRRNLRARLDVATIASITSQQGPMLPTSVFPENSGGTRNYPRDQAIGRRAWEYLRVESRCSVTVDENVVEKAAEEILTYEASDDALEGIAGINTSINRRMIARRLRSAFWSQLGPRSLTQDRFSGKVAASW